MGVVRRFDIWLVSLDPAQGHEIRKTRPCVVISPDEIHVYLKTVIIAPMTSGSFDAPSRVGVFFDGKEGKIVLDQIRTIDRGRLVKRLGTLDRATAQEVLGVLQSLFAE